MSIATRSARSRSKVAEGPARPDEPRWLSLEAVIGIHAQQVERFGGTQGVLHPGAVESAVAKPRNRLHYGSADLADLAAACMVGLTSSHGFVDGNKRAGAATMLVFLKINGRRLHVPQPELYALAMDVANGRLDEERVAAWIRARLQGG